MSNLYVLVHCDDHADQWRVAREALQLSARLGCIVRLSVSETASVDIDASRNPLEHQIADSIIHLRNMRKPADYTG